jgi:galactan 5-O-arabinofuranosyltransferase
MTASRAVERDDRAQAPLLPPAVAPARTRSRRTLVLSAGAEVVTAFGTAALAVQLSRSIRVDPLDRVGQVSGLAGLGLRFVLAGLVVLALCAAVSRAGEGVRRTVERCACAAVAGLATGLVAGGILLALRGTDWPLFADRGDSGQLIRWVDDLLAGRGIPAEYPPAVLHVTAALAELTGTSTPEALRAVQVVGTAVFGPLAYLAWRLVLPAGWALAVALLAAFPLLEPYKPYTTVVLVALVPVLVVLLSTLRRAASLSWARIAVTGLGAGVALGVLFLVYSGWFVWSAPGAVVAAGLLLPWRRAALRGLALLGLASVGLAAVAFPHLVGLLSAAGDVQDRYLYFDTSVEPAYIAMWRNDLPGDTGPWPPPGELAGVGVFTLLLVVGLGAAIALAGRRTVVLTAALLVAGAWVLRFAFAAQMYETGSVQLYPRTTPHILFCLIVLSVLAVRAGLARLPRPSAASPSRTPVVLGGLAAALLLALSMGSSLADRYLPRDDGSTALLAYVAQLVRQPDGTCPDFGAGCAADAAELLARDDPTDG